MHKFRFDKLVRDKIPGDMVAEGSEVALRQLTPQQHLEALRDKLFEEGKELVFDDPEETAKELADLREVIDCIAKVMGIDSTDIDSHQAAKREKAGSFMDGLYVESVSVADDNPRIDYYRANADRYPEVES